MPDEKPIICGNCGYDLRQDHTGDCPECGATPAERIKSIAFRRNRDALIALAGVIAVLYLGSYLLVRQRENYNANGIMTVQFHYGQSTRLYALSDAAKTDLDWSRAHAEDLANNGSWPEGYAYGTNWQYVTPAHRPAHLWRIYRPLEEIELILFPLK